MSSATNPDGIIPSTQTAGDKHVEPYANRRLRVPVALVTLYWVMFLIFGTLDLPMFTRFLARAGTFLVLLLVGFSIWWLVRGPFRLSYRFLVLGWAIVGGVITTVFMHRTVLPPSIYMLALPSLFTAWTIWLFLSRHSSERARLLGMLIIPVLVWTPGTLVRMEGLRGDGSADLHWRWKPSAEQLVQQNSADGANSEIGASQEPMTASADDWTDFRGPLRDATVPGLKIGTDWKTKPPQRIWRTQVGPAWSSMLIVGDRLFTQEQRGEIELVSCFDASTGNRVWVHDDPGRFEENLGGVGPRATPTFANGRIYALGAAGRLNCLDAASGSKVWSRDIVADASSRAPVWGFSGSPLVVDNFVIVFAGGESKKALLAYDESSGDIAWTAVAGTDSYASPQIAEFEGDRQILFVGDKQLSAYEPSSGKVLWTYNNPTDGRPVVQPRLIGDSQLLVSFVPDGGTARIKLALKGEDWTVTESWVSRDLKPDFSDFVHHDGSIYGFDGNIFCCVNLETGKRQWKKGRYGAGQVILLPDQQLLLVITENGEFVLVAADPKTHNELARFQAINGKTWNHPVISHGKLFVRNAEEMACYDIN